MQNDYNGDASACPAVPEQAKKHPTPQVPAAYQALYGKQPDSSDQPENEADITFSAAINDQHLEGINKSLPELNALIRIAAKTCNSNHQELIDGFGGNEDALLLMIENMEELSSKLSGFSELADSAFSRVMVVAARTIKDNDGGAL